MSRNLACLILVSTLLAPAGPVSAQREGQVDLSPASWPAGELETYTELNTSTPRRRGLARGENGLVVGTTGALAVRAGLEALKQGGSAADAALVTALTQVTLAAGSWASYAGVLTMVYYDAAARQVPAGTQPGKPVRYLNGEFATVLGEDDPLSIPADAPSGRTAMVPGFMAGVAAAHARFGTLPWSALFEPAIYFAEEGFVLDGDLASTIAFRAPVLGRLPETKSIFFTSDGSLPKRGEVFRQPALAATLRAVAEHGADYMYTGPWGERLVAALAAEGGKMRMEDLRRYRALWRQPRTTHYRGHALHAPGQPGAGGKLVRRAFSRLRSKNLAALGHYTESADSLYELLQATRSVYHLVPPLGSHSDGVIAIDADGNAAAILHSINTSAWGQTGIFVDGVSIPDSAAYQQKRIQAAGPGKRIWSGTNPIIVTRHRRFVAASSAIGNGLFEATAQSLVDLIDFGMTPKEAVDLGKFRSPERSAEPIATWPTRVTQGDFPSDLIQAVRNMGIPIRQLRPLQPDGRGYWIGARVDPETGKLTGATVNRFNGHAEGY